MESEALLLIKEEKDMFDSPSGDRKEIEQDR
jgi:hypothetical protein